MIYCRILIGSLAATFFLSGSAFAAKSHREGKSTIEKEFAPLKADIKKSCGCEPTASVDWASFNATAANEAKNFAKIIVYSSKAVAKAAAKFCSDPESKKLFCQHAKTLHFVPKGTSSSKVTADEKTNKLIIESSRDMAVSDRQVTDVLNAW